MSGYDMGMPSAQQRARERATALARIREAVRRGQIVKPAVCQQCERPPGTVPGRTVKTGLVPYFRRGYTRPDEILWVCHSCNDRLISRSRLPSKRIQPRYGPLYETVKHHLLVDDMTYKAIAQKYNITSAGSLAQNFRNQAIRRGEWPLPQLRERQFRKMRERRLLLAQRRKDRPRRTPWLAMEGLAAEIDELLARTRMQAYDFAIEAGFERDRFSFLLRQRGQVTFRTYARLDAALELLQEKYADYETRTVVVRSRLMDRLRVGSPTRGLRAFSELAGIDYRVIQQFLDGRTFPPRMLDPLQTALEKWEAEDGMGVAS